MDSDDNKMQLPQALRRRVEKAARLIGLTPEKVVEIAVAKGWLDREGRSISAPKEQEPD